MYESFYGLRERPFNLTPDPKFLYLSEKHKEAFAHLLYGIKNRSGFVMITGEIGTGKTTLCRNLLNQLDSNTEVAFIFNPFLSAIELMKKINQEFGIESDADTVLELTEELAKEKGIKVNEEEFKKAFEKHQEVSRAGAEAKFGGVGQRDNYDSVKLHTATHLLHQALRVVLGGHVRQMGSDITPVRLRFDFSHPSKITGEEKKMIEDLVNEKIKEDLQVVRTEMGYKQAVESGALAFFKEKYPETVSVYAAGEFSKEICAGPHVKRTSELGHFKIIKEESSSAGVRRIKAVLE